MTTAFYTSETDSSLREFYDRNGFVVVRGAFSEKEIHALDEEANRLLKCEHLIDKLNMRCRWQDNLFTGECQFETFDPIIDLSALLHDVAHDDRIFDILQQIYGEPACLFKDKLIMKRPGMKGYGLHQDWIAWPDFPRSFLTVLVPLENANCTNGCTEVFPGYHSHGSLSEENGKYHELSTELIDESCGVLLELNRGDIAIFDGFTPHRSGPNLSEVWRKQLYLSYNKLSDGGNLRTKHYADFHSWLKKRYAEYGLTNTYFE